MKKKSTLKPRRLTLRGWAALDDIGRSISEAAKEGRWQDVPELIHQTIELAVDKLDRNAFWMEVVELYNQTLEANLPIKKFPLLTSKEKSRPMPWEYPGRSWFFWLNLFAGKYGWDEWRVGGLDIDTAIGLDQGILIDEQVEQEGSW